MTTEGDSPQPPDGDDIAVLAHRARARAAAAPAADDIRNLADHAIEQINTLADKAMGQARQVDELMQRLAELLEQDNAEP